MTKENVILDLIARVERLESMWKICDICKGIGEKQVGVMPGELHLSITTKCEFCGGSGQVPKQCLEVLKVVK